MTKSTTTSETKFNRQPDIFIFDQTDIGTAEDLAMLQALYSRSSESVMVNIKKIHDIKGNIFKRYSYKLLRYLLSLYQKSNSAFMRKFYVGYGHKSIGDCGFTTIFFEGVSILAAKAIEDNSLYVGQESSTRYIDYSIQPMINPKPDLISNMILVDWMEFYNSSLKPLQAFLKTQFPRQMGQDPVIWEKAINARSFDILRGFIPTAMTTKLSWTTNLRQAQDHLTRLKFHPLAEIRDLACLTLKMLKNKYPDSFSHSDDISADIYYERIAFDTNYSEYNGYDYKENYITWSTNIVSYSDLELGNNHLALSTRPKNTLLPRYLAKYGTYTCKFLLDYGSFRDLQRHRNGICRLPLLTFHAGFNSWYLEQLPDNLKIKAKRLIAKQLNAIERIQDTYQLSREEIQYYIPLGFNVNVELIYDITQMVYVAELRSGAMVHPTLRKIAHCMVDILTEQHPVLKMYADLTEDVWDIRRGMQDIVELVD